MPLEPHTDLGSSPSATSREAARSERAVVREQQQSVEHAEHVGDLLRFRAGISISGPAWCCYSVLDWISATWDGGGRHTLVWLLSIRAGLVPLIAFSFYIAFRTKQPTARQLRALDFMIYGAAAFGIALMAVGYRGLAGNYAAGIMMVIIGRGAFWAQPWRRALVPHLFMASTYPVVMGVAACFVPAIRAQWNQPAALSNATQHVLFLYGTALMVTAATHYAWTLRRQLFESRSIGRYRLQRRLAAGGMGEVWAAYHPGLKRDIALKILRADAARDATAIARFEREVKATSDLSHPNTIRVFDFGATDDGIFYYAMELLEGMTLSQVVRSSGPLPPARAVHLITQAARSLAEAHHNGLIHRDVKPANIFVTKAGGEPDFVKVLDFGIAKRVDASPHGDVDAELTSPGLLAGTPKYMAPEIVRGAPVTPRSDVYGIGAVLYFLLTGRAPFEGKTADAVYAAQLDGRIATPSAVRGEPVAAELEQLVARCLAKDPAERYADAGELALALDDLGFRWQPHRTSMLPPRPATEIDPDDPTKITPDQAL